MLYSLPGRLLYLFTNVEWNCHWAHFVNRNMGWKVCRYITTVVNTFEYLLDDCNLPGCSCNPDLGESKKKKRGGVDIWTKCSVKLIIKNWSHNGDNNCERTSWMEGAMLRGNEARAQEGGSTLLEGHVLFVPLLLATIIQCAVHSWWQHNKNMIILIPYLSLHIPPIPNPDLGQFIRTLKSIFLSCRFDFCGFHDPKLKNGHSHENVRFVAAAPGAPPFGPVCSSLACSSNM